MKEIYLIYNNFSNEYYLDFGRNFKDRNYLGKISEEEVINELKNKINFKRESILYLGKEISVGLAEKINYLVKGTKVLVGIEKLG